MDDGTERLRDLQQQLSQLDIEADGSALTPGEARKNAEERAAVLEELRKLGGSEVPGDAAGR